MEPADAPQRARGQRPWSWRPFRLLAQAQAAHAAADGMVAVALSSTLFFSVPLGEARAKVALYLAITMAPFAVLSPLVGPWLDRRPGSYRLGIVGAGVGRVLLCVLLSSRTERLSLYPLAFGLLVLSRVHGVSRAALVPDALPPGRHAIWVNAWLAVVSVLAGAAGASVAAATNALAGPDLALWVAATLFGVLLVPALGLPAGTGSGRRSPPEGPGGLTARILAGGRGMAASRAAVGFLTFLLAFVLKAEGESARGFSVVLAAAAVGGLAGSVVAPLLRNVLREALLLSTSLLLMAGASLWAAGSFGLLRAAVVTGAVGLGACAGRLAFDSLLQDEAPESVRGRTFARYETVFQIWWVVGAELATAVHFGAASGLRVLAAIALAGLALSARGLRRPPARAAIPQIDEGR